MKQVTVFIITLLTALTVFAGFQGDTSSAIDLYTGIRCSTGMTCTKAKGYMVLTSLNTSPYNQVAATATTITAAQCGSTFYNAGAVAMNLPEASTVVGCRYTFVTLNAANFDVNPDNADQILVLTDAAGDSIRNATLGNAIILQAVSASQWVQVGGQGTYADIN